MHIYKAIFHSSHDELGQQLILYLDINIIIKKQTLFGLNTDNAENVELYCVTSTFLWKSF